MCRRPVGRMPLMTRFVFDSGPVAKLPFPARNPFGVRRSCRRFDRVMVRDLASPFDTGDEAYIAKAGARLPHSKPLLLGRAEARPYNIPPRPGALASLPPNPRRTPIACAVSPT